MKARAKRIATVSMLVGALLVPVASAGGNRPVRQAIGEAWRLHIQAAIDKDKTRVMELYTPDCIFSIPGSSELHGFDEIAALEARSLETTELINAKHTTDELRVYGDRAYELGTVVGPMRSAGQEQAAVVTFRFMALWEKGDDGAWRIRHFVGLPDGG